MTFDAFRDARTIEDGDQLHADVCIAGAGAAGITLARELVRSGVESVGRPTIPTARGCAISAARPITPVKSPLDAVRAAIVVEPIVAEHRGSA